MANYYEENTYWLIDTIMGEDEIVYEVYQNDRDEVIYIPVGKY